MGTACIYILSELRKMSLTCKNYEKDSLRREITSKAYSDKNFSGDKDFSGVKDSPETCYVRDMIALDVSLFH